MEKWITPALSVCAVAIIAALFMGRKHAYEKRHGNNGYDERQILARGQAYKNAFFTTLLYMAVYACIDAGGTVWCEPSVGMSTGIFLGVTVFAVTAIIRDAFYSAGTSKKYVLILFCLVIVSQMVGFVGEMLHGSLLVNGMLTASFINLFCAVCFIIILAVYLVHEKKTECGEDEV